MLDIDTIKRFYALTMGHGALAMIEEGKKCIRIFLNLIMLKIFEQALEPTYEYFVGL